MSQFTIWWQHMPERMNPVMFSIGSFAVQYYGLMYLVAFTVAYFLAKRRIRTESAIRINLETLQSLMTSMIIGVLAGARLGYVLFYNLSYFLRHPLEIILPVTFAGGFRFTGISGMSFHGGLLGCIIAAVIFSRRRRLSFVSVTDFIIPCIPLGYTFGRLGNFINGELYGRETERAVGMYFPGAPGNGLRHPSQLYEAFLEGIVLFVLLWGFRKRIKTPGAMLPLYLIGYGTVRFFVEFTREPDAHLGFIFLQFSMGQLLCFLMVLSGGILYAVMRLRARKS